jgi:hypothetical protein
MNTSILPNQAVLHYADADYMIIKNGSFVVCAVSGKPIALDALKYWNPTTQEAFFGPEEALSRWKTLNP